MPDLMDNAMRRANHRLGKAQCEARDALLIGLAKSAIPVGEVGAKSLTEALDLFMLVLNEPVPMVDHQPIGEYYVDSWCLEGAGWSVVFRRPVVPGVADDSPIYVIAKSVGVSFGRDPHKRYRITIEEIKP